jgi:hypothetical protein
MNGLYVVYHRKHKQPQFSWLGIRMACAVETGASRHANMRKSGLRETSRVSPDWEQFWKSVQIGLIIGPRIRRLSKRLGSIHPVLLCMNTEPIHLKATWKKHHPYLVSRHSQFTNNLPQKMGICKFPPKPNHLKNSAPSQLSCLRHGSNKYYGKGLATN